MKTIISILSFISGVIAIPIGVTMIINGDRPLLFGILLAMIIPGFITSSVYLYKKYDW